MTDRSDATLVRAHLDGDSTAFDAIVAAHGAGVISAVERVVEDHHLALDVAQDAFVELHRVLPRYREEGKFRAMLYSIALNRARDARRRRGRAKLVFLESPGDDLVAEDPTAASDERAAIDGALRRVDEPYRSAVHLRDVLGFDYDEIATALDVEVGTAKSRVNRGRLQFRDHYERLAAPRGGRGGHRAG